MPGPETAAPAWKVTRRRDRTGWSYLLDGNGLWWCPTFTRRWALEELDGSEFGPTVPVDVDNVEALLADVECLRAVADITDAATAYVEADPDRDDVPQLWEELRGAVGHYRAVQARRREVDRG